MDSIVRYVVTPRQYELILDRIASHSLPLMPSADAVYKSEARSAEPQVLVRQSTNVFLKAYFAGQLANLLLVLRKSPTRLAARSVAASIALLVAVFRAVSLVTKNRSLGPALAALIASPAFKLLPESVRPFLALYTAAKACEYAYNYFDDKNMLEWKPRWLGSWLLFPVAMSQLFYMFVVHPEHCPRSFRLFMTTLSGSYLPVKPVGYPDSEHWPSQTEIMAGVSEIARLKFPTFKSPLIFRNQSWSETLAPISGVLQYAHPGNKTMTGALLHPSTASELATFFETVGANFSSTTRYIFPLYLVLTLLKRKSGDVSTRDALINASSSTLRTSTSIAMTAASAWAGIGLSQRMLGTKTLTSTRFRMIGFMSGLWAFIDQVNGRARNFYVLRLAIMSQYNLITARRGGRPLMPNGDVLLFGCSLAVIASLMTTYPMAVSSPRVRKLLNWLRTGDNVDPSPL